MCRVVMQVHSAPRSGYMTSPTFVLPLRHLLQPFVYSHNTEAIPTDTNHCLHAILPEHRGKNAFHTLSLAQRKIMGAPMLGTIKVADMQLNGKQVFLGGGEVIQGSTLMQGK